MINNKNNDKPLVSIIIPVYNGSNYLKEAINSALNQTYDNFEIIVINDGSNDDGKTEDICYQYKDEITYYYKENGGISSALNMGVEKMNGKYFSWLSHDDLYHEKKLEIQIDILAKYNFESNMMASANFDLINANGEVIRKGRNNKARVLLSNEFFDFLHKNSINGCGLLIPKNLILTINKFKTEFKYIQDFVAWSNMALNKAVLIDSGKVLTSTRIHGEQQTIKISDRYKIEVETYLNDLIKSDMIEGNLVKSILDYAIKNGKWKLIKDFYRKHKGNLSISYKFNIPFKRVKEYLIRKAKLIYWKLKRR